MNTVPRVKRNHVFDKRNEITIRDIKAGRAPHQTVLCLRCKRRIVDPSSSCSGKDRVNE